MGFITAPTSVSAAGWSEDKGMRNEMEDGFVFVDDFLAKEFAFFAIYDGHGGQSAMQYCVDFLHLNLYHELTKLSMRTGDEQQERTQQELGVGGGGTLVSGGSAPSSRGCFTSARSLLHCSQRDIGTAMMMAFKLTDKNLIEVGVDSGATACCCLLVNQDAKSAAEKGADGVGEVEKLEVEVEEPDGDVSGASSTSAAMLRDKSIRRVLYTAHVGDARVVLCRRGEAFRLTNLSDHKSNCPLERKRVHDAGGTIIFDRVNGMLAIARAFGDFQLKMPFLSKDVVSNTPDVTCTILEPTDTFVILACDGLWDVYRPEAGHGGNEGAGGSLQLARILPIKTTRGKQEGEVLYSVSSEITAETLQKLPFVNCPEDFPELKGDLEQSSATWWCHMNVRLTPRSKHQAQQALPSADCSPSLAVAGPLLQQHDQARPTSSVGVVAVTSTGGRSRSSGCRSVSSPPGEGECHRCGTLPTIETQPDASHPSCGENETVIDESGCGYIDVIHPSACDDVYDPVDTPEYHALLRRLQKACELDAAAEISFNWREDIKTHFPSLFDHPWHLVEFDGKTVPSWRSDPQCARSKSDTLKDLAWFVREVELGNRTWRRNVELEAEARQLLEGLIAQAMGSKKKAHEKALALVNEGMKNSDSLIDAWYYCVFELLREKLLQQHLCALFKRSVSVSVEIAAGNPAARGKVSTEQEDPEAEDRFPSDEHEQLESTFGEPRACASAGGNQGPTFADNSPERISHVTSRSSKSPDGRDTQTRANVATEDQEHTTNCGNKNLRPRCAATCSDSINWMPGREREQGSIMHHDPTTVPTESSRGLFSSESKLGKWLKSSRSLVEKHVRDLKNEPHYRIFCDRLLCPETYATYYRNILPGSLLRVFEMNMFQTVDEEELRAARKRETEQMQGYEYRFPGMFAIMVRNIGEHMGENFPAWYKRLKEPEQRQIFTRAREEMKNDLVTIFLNSPDAKSHNIRSQEDLTKRRARLEDLFYFCVFQSVPGFRPDLRAVRRAWSEGLQVEGSAKEKNSRGWSQLMIAVNEQDEEGVAEELKRMRDFSEREKKRNVRRQQAAVDGSEVVGEGPACPGGIKGDGRITYAALLGYKNSFRETASDHAEQYVFEAQFDGSPSERRTAFAIACLLREQTINAANDILQVEVEEGPS